MSGPVFAGVDAGSSFTKAVLIGPDDAVLGESVVRTGMDFAAAARKALDAAGAPAGTPLVATGLGRSRAEGASAALTEISCLARAGTHLLGGAHAVVDIGGQDNKVVRVGADGNRLDFKMNRKCAAGTGAFLEEISTRLDVSPEDMNALAREAESAVEIGSYCTVFTCTEILHHIRNGEEPAAILRGCYGSVARRITEMDPLDGEVLLSGGVVATHPVIVDIFAEFLGKRPHVPDRPQMTGALGAALICRERVRQGEPVS